MQLTGGIAGLRQLADCGVFERRHAGSPVRGLDYRLRPWEPADRDAVIALITGIQRGEFRFPIATSDQPGPVIGGHDRRHENRRGHRRTTHA
jgi:hypothetical protein